MPKLPHSQIEITHSTLDQFRIGWSEEGDVALTDMPIRTSFATLFSLDDWRQKPEEVGKVAFRLFLPTEIQEIMFVRRNWTLQLVTDWPDVPWELMHDSQEFLCLSTGMARKAKQGKMLKWRSRIDIGKLKDPKRMLRALVVGNPEGDLDGAQSEAEEITVALRELNVMVDVLVGPSQATAREFTLRIANNFYDVIHFAGHSTFNKSNANQSSLIFRDAVVLAEELERTLTGRPFLFLSACKAGRTKTESIQGLGYFFEGLASAAIMNGAIGCLAPIWDIDDGLAKEFALCFYDNLIRRKTTIGEAVRQARLQVREIAPSPDYWASWVLYGDPRSRFLKGGRKTE